MSTSVNNAGLEAIPSLAGPVLSAARGGVAGPAVTGRDALQALLAFAALHEQVRQRRVHADKDDGGDVAQLEQFVLDEVLQLVAERARALTGADGVAIALAEGDAIVCHGSTGKIAPDPGVRLDPTAGFSGACLSSGQVVRCDDSEIDLRVDPLACRNLGARSMVAVPLLAKDTVIGLIEAFSAEAYGFDDRDVRSLALLAELILAALKPEEEDRLAEISRKVVGPGLSTAAAPKIPTIVAEVTADLSQPSESEPAPVLPTASSYESLESARPGLAMVLVLVLFAAALGGGLWWSIRRHTSSPVRKIQSAAPATAPVAPTGATAAAPLPAADAENLHEEESSLPTPVPEKPGTQPEVTGIRHWSSPDSSTVVIDLQDQVQYEAHRLANPERIYFDLFDTRLADDLSNKKIEVGDALLQRVRVAQPVRGVTRVVLETKGASNFSVSMELNPYRLVVEVRKIGAPPPQRTKVDLFGTAEPNAIETAHVEAAPIVPKFRIALDAGHGGWDLGTVGREGLMEKDLALDIVRRLGKLVQTRLGAEVIYTRADDNYVPLEKRAEIANVSKADLFVSVHANYSDSTSARGVETYYTNTYSSVKARLTEDESDPALQNIDWTHVDIRDKVRGSHRFAADVQRALYATLAVKNPGLPNRGVKEAQYVVLTGTTMPAVLAEVSFVSSPTDENNLRNAAYREQIAEALCKGISRYAQDTSRTKLASASLKNVAR
jgi:N-acetylmuramoyl-L-alanine amidase/putative methionine-R-sulfoxide reductase with GAF domain